MDPRKIKDKKYHACFQKLQRRGQFQQQTENFRKISANKSHNPSLQADNFYIIGQFVIRQSVINFVQKQIYRVCN